MSTKDVKAVFNLFKDHPDIRLVRPTSPISRRTRMLLCDGFHANEVLAKERFGARRQNLPWEFAMLDTRSSVVMKVNWKTGVRFFHFKANRIYPQHTFPQFDSISRFILTDLTKEEEIFKNEAEAQFKRLDLGEVLSMKTIFNEEIIFRNDLFAKKWKWEI